MKRSTRSLFRDYGITILIAVSVAVLVRNYVIEAYRIPTQAMRPTLLAGDTIFVDKSKSFARNYFPNRGDVIVFSAPSDDETGQLNFIRRVVGLPGDEVAIKEGLVYLNGKSLSGTEPPQNSCFEEKIPDGHSYTICREPPLPPTLDPERVPPGSVFVLGDFRTQLDQQKRKPWRRVPLTAVKGKALWIWLSIEPSSNEPSQHHFFPRLRWNRMFKRIQ